MYFACLAARKFGSLVWSIHDCPTSTISVTGCVMVQSYMSLMVRVIGSVLVAQYCLACDLPKEGQRRKKQRLIYSRNKWLGLSCRHLYCATGIDTLKSFHLIRIPLQVTLMCCSHFLLCVCVFLKLNSYKPCGPLIQSTGINSKLQSLVDSTFCYRIRNCMGSLMT